MTRSINLNSGDCGYNKTSCCPICDFREINLLSPSWKRYYNEKEFFLADREWFVACDQCGTIFRYPLLDYDDYKKYGEDYYNQVNPGESVQEHAVWHFESFQKHNYDSLRAFLNQNIPPHDAKRWLDVGSIGYATSFEEYDFTTIEPDKRIVDLGRKLFKRDGVKGLLGIDPRIHSHTIESYQDSRLFDGIVFNNSFYCLPFPMDGLRKASNLLSDNGHLVITISTYFCDAVAVRTDGLLSKIEDVLQGETLWVFHNAKSLEYLCQRAGFELVGSHEIAAYGKKTMRLFHFRKKVGVSPAPALLVDSRALMQEKLTQLFQGFSEQSRRSLVEHNNEATFFIGTLSLLHDLSRICRLDKITAYVVFDSPLSDCQIEGVRCLSWDRFCSMVNSSPGYYSAVIASYKFQDEIFEKVAALKSSLSVLYRPNRKSGMETLFFDFDGALQPNKGVTLDRVL